MQAGKLDRRIEILRAAEVTNGFNEPVADWAVVATVWASAKDVSDAERMRSREVAAEITTRFVVRHNSVTATVTPRDRIRHSGKVYDIAGMKELGRREGLELSATARADLR